MSSHSPRGEIILNLSLGPLDSLYEASALADELIDDMDYRVLYDVAGIVAQASLEAEELESSKWHVLACKYHPECSYDVTIRNLDFLPYVGQKEEILEFIDGFRSIQEHEYTISSYVTDRHHGEQVPRPDRQLEMELRKLREGKKPTIDTEPGTG